MSHLSAREHEIGLTAMLLGIAALARGGDHDAAARLLGSVSVWRSCASAASPELTDRWRHLEDVVRDRCGDRYETLFLDGAAGSPWDAVAELQARVHPPALDGLSPREIDVLRLVASGAPNKEIGRALGLRTKTVMHHTAAIYRKLGVRGRTEAAAVAFSAGLACPRA